MIAQESRANTIGEMVAALKHKEVYRAAAQIGDDWNKERLLSKGATQAVLDQFQTIIKRLSHEQTLVPS